MWSPKATGLEDGEYYLLNLLLFQLATSLPCSCLDDDDVDSVQ